MPKFDVWYSYNAPTLEHPHAVVKGADTIEVTLDELAEMESPVDDMVFVSKIKGHDKPNFTLLKVTALAPLGED